MDKYPKRVSKIFERNIRQINRIVANIIAICSVVILLMTFLSVTGFFEFGTSYTYFVIIVGLPEVLYGVYTRNHLFLSYAAYFTFEYIVVTSILYCLVKRVNRLIQECDQMNDSLEPIKQTKGSHSAVAGEHMDNTDSYSEWIQYSYDHIVIQESAPDLFKYLCKLY